MIDTKPVLTIVVVFFFLGPLGGSMTSYGQSWKDKLSSVVDPNFEIVGAINVGTHKQSRTEKDILGLVVIYAPDKYLKQTYVTGFLRKIKPEFRDTESYYVYFHNDRELAKRSFREFEKNGEGKDEDLYLKSIKAVFISYRGERKKEVLRFFENGMKNSDLDLLENDLEN